MAQTRRRMWALQARSHTVLMKLWDESDITLMRIRANCCLQLHCIMVRSHGAVISQTWSPCTVMWIRTQVWNFKKNACSTERSAMWGYSSAQIPRFRLEDYNAVHLSLFFICGSWLEHSSEFVHYVFFLSLSVETIKDVHSKASFSL